MEETDRARYDNNRRLLIITKHFLSAHSKLRVSCIWSYLMLNNSIRLLSPFSSQHGKLEILGDEVTWSTTYNGKVEPGFEHRSISFPVVGIQSSTWQQHIRSIQKPSVQTSSWYWVSRMKSQGYLHRMVHCRMCSFILSLSFSFFRYWISTNPCSS